MTEIETRARNYLLDVSSDDCWIDATSRYAVNKLIALLLEQRSGHWSEYLAMAVEAWRDAFTRGVRAALTYRLERGRLE